MSARDSAATRRGGCPTLGGVLLVMVVGAGLGIEVSYLHGTVVAAWGLLGAFACVLVVIAYEVGKMSGGVKP